jgi:hypothetical protein
MFIARECINMKSWSVDSKIDAGSYVSSFFSVVCNADHFSETL